VKAGFDIQDALPVELPRMAVASREDEEENLLRELSGLFLVVLAGFVLICGSLVSLFLRIR